MENTPCRVLIAHHYFAQTHPPNTPTHAPPPITRLGDDHLVAHWVASRHIRVAERLWMVSAGVSALGLLLATAQSCSSAGLFEANCPALRYVPYTNTALQTQPATRLVK